MNVAQWRWVVTGKLDDGGGGDWLRKSKGSFGWKDRKCREDRKDFSFPHLCLVGRMEKWMNKKLFYFVENKVCIN